MDDSAEGLAPPLSRYIIKFGDRLMAGKKALNRLVKKYRVAAC